MRVRLEALLGLAPHVVQPRPVRVLSESRGNSYKLETLEIIGAAGQPIPALFTRPLGDGPFPAVLYLHAHGNRYDIGKRELIEGRPSLQQPAYAEALAQRGIAALCLDMATFGERAGDREQEISKRLLWQGRTLFGAMLADLRVGLDALAQRSDVDATRIGAFGLSMGATQAFWLAALDDRVMALAHLCCFADLRWLVEHGPHDLHGIYMMVPGLVGVVSTGEIAAAAVPRPQLCCVGLADPLTPKPAVEIAAHVVAARYHALGAGANWRLHSEPTGGHAETSSMRALVLDHFSTAFARDGAM